MNTVDLTHDERALFRLLAERTRVLAVVCDNAAVVLSEDFEDMVRGPLSAVQEILAKIPVRTAWDGSYSDADTTVEYFAHEAHKGNPVVGVRVRHLPTDLAAEAYQKPTREENDQLARKALRGLVQRFWEGAGRAP